MTGPIFTPGAPPPRLGVDAAGDLPMGRARAAHGRKVAAWAYHSLVSLRSSIWPCLREDREDHLLAMAAKAQATADASDFKGSFGVVRALAHRTPKQLKTVMLENGAMAESETERQQRWVRHFTGVFSATNVEVSRRWCRSQFAQ